MTQRADERTGRRPESGDIVPASRRLQTQTLIEGPQPVLKAVRRIDAVDVVHSDDGTAHVTDVVEGGRVRVENRIGKPVRRTLRLVGECHDPRHDWR